MTITKELIKATAETYPADELRAKRTEMMEKLAELDFVSSASTGAGASYSISQRAGVEEMIELYTLALEYQNSGEVRSGAEIYRVYFY